MDKQNNTRHILFVSIFLWASFPLLYCKAFFVMASPFTIKKHLFCQFIILLSFSFFLFIACDLRQKVLTLRA